MKTTSIQSMEKNRGKSGKSMRIGICHTRWNEKVVNALVKGCIQTLLNENVAQEDIVVFSCAGAYELPYTASMVIKSKQVDAVICIGCLIKGDTMHFEYISEAVTHGIMNLNLSTGTPVIYGVLNCATEEQALFRAGLTSDGHNHGKEWAQTAIEMAALKKTCYIKQCPANTPMISHLLITAVVVLSTFAHFVYRRR